MTSTTPPAPRDASDAPTRPMSRGLLWLMSGATGLTVACNYYVQPLLNTIAQDLGLSLSAAGALVTTAQLTYGAGLFLLVPVADMRERRSMIVFLMLLATAGLVVSSVAPSLPVLLLGTAITGFCSVVAQVLVPFAATLATPAERGRAVGTVMSGLLLGILLARTVAGAISSLLHWRAVYAVAAIAMLCCAAALWRALPRLRQDVGLSYGRLLLSVVQLYREEPVLRVRTVIGMLAFVLFSLFWTPLAFLLAAPPYGYPDAVIGLFGLVGAAGALSASWAGRLADAGRGQLGVWIGLAGLLLAWAPLGLGQSSVIALVVGVLVLDLAVQLVHVSNQNTVYALRPEARNRINAGYMGCYFIGGAIGSWSAAWIYPHAGWPGIVTAGVAVSVAGLLIAWVKLKR